MYRGAETSSSFYQSMRQAFAGDAGHSSGVDSRGAYDGRATLAEIQYRLNAIGRPASGAPSNHGGATFTQVRPPQQSPVNASSASPASKRTLAESAQAALEPSRHEPMVPAPPQVGVDEDETLTPAELRSLRMIEFAAPVRVLLGELHHPPRPMQLLAEEANVKIFPRHVYISRPHNGAPIAEIVILELSELTEDEQKGTLSFFIRKPNEQTTTIVEVFCADPAARSAMYKIVCSKRSLLETDGTTQRSTSR